MRRGAQQCLVGHSNASGGTAMFIHCALINAFILLTRQVPFGTYRNFPDINLLFMTSIGFFSFFTFKLIDVSLMFKIEVSRVFMPFEHKI